jgi:predicted deacylase
VTSLFADTYTEARAQFLAAATQVVARTSCHRITARGPRDEQLAIDTARVGSDHPHTLVLLTSGVHGLEGHAGSALQQLWLTQFAHDLPRGVGVLLVHAVNPFGFAHGRRVNENNVDLNRNALAHFPGPHNAGYPGLNAWLNPRSPVPGLDDFMLRGFWHRLRHGIPALQQAVAGGQYEFPLGLFYGGDGTQESLRLVAEILADPWLHDAHTVLHIDLHTGLGARGSYEMLLDYAPQSPEFAAFTRWFDPAHVVSDHADGASNYVAHGMVTQLIERAFAAARTYTTVVDFGTTTPTRILQTLRAENRLHHHGCANAQRAARVRADLREAFYPTDSAWRDRLLAHGHDIFTRLSGALASGLE